MGHSTRATKERLLMAIGMQTTQLQPGWKISEGFVAPEGSVCAGCAAGAGYAELSDPEGEGTIASYP